AAHVVVRPSENVTLVLPRTTLNLLLPSPRRGRGVGGEGASVRKGLLQGQYGRSATSQYRTRSSIGSSHPRVTSFPRTRCSETAPDCRDPADRPGPAPVPPGPERRSCCGSATRDLCG